MWQLCAGQRSVLNTGTLCHLWPGQSLTRGKDNAKDWSAVLFNMVGHRTVQDSSTPTVHIWCLFYLIHLLEQGCKTQIQKVRHEGWRNKCYFPYIWYFQHFNYEDCITHYFIFLSPLRLNIWNINTVVVVVVLDQHFCSPYTTLYCLWVVNSLDHSAWHLAVLNGAMTSEQMHS